MKYQIYKLEFSTAVHFGKRRLEDAEYTFSADLLFSALCQEAVQQNVEEGIAKLMSMVADKTLRFSDAFPYHQQHLYIPKPMLQIEYKNQGDSSEKKLYKKLNYIKWELLQDYLNGDFDIKNELSTLNTIGKTEIRTRVAVMEEEGSMPYSVGTYYFNKGWGLYFILAYKQEEDKQYIEELLESLELVGIGGKRSSGLGKFTLNSCKMPKKFEDMLNASEDVSRYISLTTCLVENDKIEDILLDAKYSLIRKSGFVASDTYAKGFFRKKDIYMFKSGASFGKTFNGYVADVSHNGTHPVYRYGMPIFLGVKL